MNTTNDLSITVFGKAAAGKSTIAMIIQEALNNAGIACVVRSEDTHPDALVDGQSERVQRIRQRLDLEGQAIEINQVQLRRGA